MSRLLLVDDEAELTEILATLLEMQGYSVVTARNGAEALAILEKDNFDLILTDTNMPQMSGDQFVREYRKQNLDTPIILVMSGDTNYHEYMAYEEGVHRILSKPFSVDDLRKTIDELLKPQDEALCLPIPNDDKYDLLNPPLLYSGEIDASTFCLGKKGFSLYLEKIKFLDQMPLPFQLNLKQSEGLDIELSGWGFIRWMYQHPEPRLNGSPIYWAGVEIGGLDSRCISIFFELIKQRGLDQVIPAPRIISDQASLQAKLRAS